MTVTMLPKPPWILDWCVWRVTGATSPRPVGVPRKIPDAYIFFPAWHLWVLGGRKPGKRPPSVPRDLRAYPWREQHHRDLVARITQPPAPVPPLASRAQRVWFTAEDPLFALPAPRGKVALCADPAFSGKVTADLVAQYRARDGLVYSWVGRVDDPPGANNAAPRYYLARRLREQFNLDEAVGQGEVPDELEDCTGIRPDGDIRPVPGGAARIVCGNANSFTAQQRATYTELVEAGTLAPLIQETYANEGDPFPDGTGTQGVPVASYLLGCYPGRVADLNIPDYKLRTAPAAWDQVSVYYARPDTEWSELTP